MLSHLLTGFLLLFMLLVIFTAADPVKLDNRQHYSLSRTKRASPTVNDRAGCKPGAQAPPNRVNTTQWLGQLRQQFTTANITAYIITNDNPHLVGPFE